MITWWKTISNWGILPEMPEQQHRGVLLSNRLAAIVFVLNAVTALAVALMFQWSPVIILVLLSNIACAAVLVLNHYGYVNSSRMLLCSFLPVSILGITLFAKLQYPNVEEVSFFTSSIAMLVVSILPIIIFELKEQRFLYTALAVNGLCLLFYDTTHNLAGVGYYQLGFSAAGYGFFRFVVLMLYALLVTGFLYYKKILEQAEHDLLLSHLQLHHYYAELGQQHQEMLVHTNKLQESQQQLQQANQLIEQQKGLLEAENIQLHQRLLEKNKILESSNRALHSRLEDMQQFSYTISHNLRGPVANLLGLASLFTAEGENPRNHQIMIHTRTAAATLDRVIRDLSQVLQMQDRKEAVETIRLDHLLENLLFSLEKEQNVADLQIEKHLEVKQLQCVKAYLYSILYNLISNALKYSHPKRACKIEIGTRSVKEGVLLEVKDNGVGIDLEAHGKDLFRMYKRFNEGCDGRGLGLYLIKTQAELLGGYVEVQSKPGEGTMFSIWLPHYTPAATERKPEQTIRTRVM